MPRAARGALPGQPSGWKDEPGESQRANEEVLAWLVPAAVFKIVELRVTRVAGGFDSNALPFASRSRGRVDRGRRPRRRRITEVNSPMRSSSMATKEPLK